MIIERFAKNLVKTRIFDIYIATGFFASLIFFIVNMDYYTPFEMIIGTVFFTILLKAISYLMFSMVVLLFNLENKELELKFEVEKRHIEELTTELELKLVKESLDKVIKGEDKK